MSLLKCRGCSCSVASSSLEAHLRLELGYAQWRCGLCPVRFAVFADAEAHFAGLFTPHPSHAPFILEARDADLHNRLSCLYKESLANDDAKQLTRSEEEDLAWHDKGFESGNDDTKPLTRSEDEDLAWHDKGFESEAEAAPGISVDEETAVEAKEEPEAAQVTRRRANKRGDRTTARADCALCDRRVPVVNMKHHVVSHHLGTKPLHCVHCSFGAIDKRSIKTHLKKTHQQPFVDEHWRSTMERLLPRIHELVFECFGVGLLYLRK